MDRRAGVYDERETLDDAARATHHLQLLKQTAEICWERSDFYRGKLEQAGIKPGDVTSIDDLARIPVTAKYEARAAMTGLGTFPLSEARRIYVSPGPHFYASQRRADPSPERGKTPLALAFHAMGFRENDIVLNTFSYHLSPGGFGIEEQLSVAGCAVVPAGPGNTEVQAEVLAKLPVTGYVGTPSFLKLLCDKALELQLEPRKDWNLEVAFVTAEKLTEQMRQELEEATGALVRQIYGSADGLLPAYECWANTGMHLHPDQIVEVLDPVTRARVATGEAGEIIATCPNPNRPLLRFATGDLVILRDDPCPCGRTGARIARIAGRVGEATKVRGMFVYPEQIETVMARMPLVERWQAIVERGARGTDELTVQIELNDIERSDGEPKHFVERIAMELREAIRVRPDVVVVPAGSIAPDAKRLDDRRSYE